MTDDIQVKEKQPRTLRYYLRLFLTGFAMGSADVVPGVSGGTMAFILGVYEDLLNAIKSFNLDVIKAALRFKIKHIFEIVPWQFLLALGAGIIVAVLSLAQFLEYVLHNQPVYLFAFFVGLVVASIIAVGAKVKWSAVPLVMLVVGAVVAFAIININPAEGSHDPLTLFLSGAVAICAMILPGISGSFILLILGQYAFVLGAVNDRDFISLGALALGCLVGILAFSRVLSWLLKKYEHPTVATLVGFMVGSLYLIWPFAAKSIPTGEEAIEIVPPALASGEFFIAIVLMVLGFVAVTVLDHLYTKANPVLRPFWHPGSKPSVTAPEPGGAD